MSNLLFIPFQAYIKDLCIKHKQVLHNDVSNIAFVRMQSHDDLSAIKSIASGMLVIMSTFTGRAIGAPDDNMLQQHASLIFLNRQPTGTGDPAGEIEDAQELAMGVMFDFYARMKKDQADDDCGIMQYLISEQMIFSPVDGPVLEDHYGWEMIIPFSTDAPAYDGNKWNP